MPKKLKIYRLTYYLEVDPEYFPNKKSILSNLSTNINVGNGLWANIYSENVKSEDGCLVPGVEIEEIKP